MDALAPVRVLDRYQQRHRGLGFPLAVLKKYSDDEGGSLAGLISYYGFFSLFPLLLVFVSVLGFVLKGNASAQRSIVNSALRQFPIIGGGLQNHALTGSGVALGVGIVGSLLSGLGVTLAAQNAFNRIYAVPHKDRPNFLFARVRGLGLLAVLGMLQVISSTAAGLVSGGFGGTGLKIAGIALALALNLILFFAAFRLLTDSSIPTNELWTGIILSSVLWEILQAVGGAYISHVVKGASETYGTFAAVIGLLTWISLGARIVVYAAEANVVRSRALWPRSLIDPPVPADRDTLRALAKIEERDDREQVEVSFDSANDSGVSFDSANDSGGEAPETQPDPEAGGGEAERRAPPEKQEE